MRGAPLSLIAELKRRNVFRVSIAYLALGWIVTQVTTTVAPMLHLPDWVGPVVLWIGVIAFPFVVMFSWIYELTPEGLKREIEIDRSASITHHTARRLDYVVIALLVVAIGLYGYHEFRSAGDQRVTVVARTTPGATAAGADRSVAVLPFVDMSADKDQEYFADGISEELLNLLAQIPQLRVIARTSSFAFKGKEVDIAEIAKKLNVANVLEGSVRKSGDKLRITAQLIRASDSSHLWSQTYDRELTDVFTVQDEIAAAVVEQLKVTLLGSAPKARVTDPKAYGLFLQARELGRQYSAEGVRAGDCALQAGPGDRPDLCAGVGGLVLHVLRADGPRRADDRAGASRSATRRSRTRSHTTRPTRRRTRNRLCSKGSSGGTMPPRRGTWSRPSPLIRPTWTPWASRRSSPGAWAAWTSRSRSASTRSRGIR